MNNADVVVVLPGIMGSTLGVRGKDGSPAGDNLFWAPSGGAVWNLLTRRNSILDHALPEGIGDAHPGDGVEPVGLMPDVHAIPGIWTPLKGYDVLVNHLRSLGYHEATGDRPANLILAPYDWRLSNRYNGQRLGTIIEPALDRWRAQGGQYADARVVFVCHSMGGLVARWYIERCGGHEVTRKLITLGTPWRGATNAIEQLVNGVRKGVGPLSINLTDFARSLPSLHQLMPEFACITDGSGFLKTTETTVPELRTEMVKDAMAFHTDLQEAERGRAESRAMAHLVVGIRQPTNTYTTLFRSHHSPAGQRTRYGLGDVRVGERLRRWDRPTDRGDWARRAPGHQHRRARAREPQRPAVQPLRARPGPGTPHGHAGPSSRPLDRQSACPGAGPRRRGRAARGGRRHRRGCRCRPARGRTAVLARDHGHHREGQGHRPRGRHARR